MDDLMLDLSSMTDGPLHSLMERRAEGRYQSKQMGKNRSYTPEQMQNYKKLELPTFIDYAIYNRYDV